MWLLRDDLFDLEDVANAIIADMIGHVHPPDLSSGPWRLRPGLSSIRTER
jgi:hypothetical protein